MERDRRGEKLSPKPPCLPIVCTTNKQQPIHSTQKCHKTSLLPASTSPSSPTSLFSEATKLKQFIQLQPSRLKLVPATAAKRAQYTGTEPSTDNSSRQYTESFPNFWSKPTQSNIPQPLWYTPIPILQKSKQKLKISSRRTAQRRA
jgi:hypothetical protein